MSNERPKPVITPWLTGGLIAAISANAVFSAVLVLKLGSYEETKREAQEVIASTSAANTELATLKVEIESLNKQKDALSPLVGDWEKRLKEKAEATAAVAALEEKEIQVGNSLTLTEQKFDTAQKRLLEADRQLTAILGENEKSKAESIVLSRTNSNLKASLALAAEAEQRLVIAKTAVTNSDGIRKQLETEIGGLQGRYAQLKAETDSLRTTRDTLNEEIASARQGVQVLKDQLSSYRSQVDPLKSRQSAVQEEGLKLTRIELQVAIAETKLKALEIGNERSTAESKQLATQLKEARGNVALWELRRETTKGAYSNLETDISAARTTIQEMSTKRDALVRETGALEANVTDLQKERDLLNTEIGKLETERAKKAEKD